MNLGGYEIQLFATFLVILACAFVALLMDYLKGSHEQLRERHVDLLVRQEKYTGQASVDVTALTTTIRSALAEQTGVMRELIAAKRRSGMIEPQKVEPSIPPVHLRDIPVESIPEPKRTVSAEAVPEAEKVKISFVPEALNVIPFQVPEVPAAPVFAQPEPAPVLDEAPIDEVLPEDSSTDEQSDEQSDQQLAEEPAIEAMLEAMMVATEGSVSPETEPEPAAGLVESETLPCGVQPPEVLAGMVQQGIRFAGQVVCIGINDYEDMKQKSSKAGAENYLAAVDQLLRGLLRSDNTLVRSLDDEYLLIEPGLNGPFAQRRLNEISEKLWDFQLRNLGNFNVVFSWGAQEAQAEPLGDVIEKARERMIETRTGRRNSSLEKSLRRLATA